MLCNEGVERMFTFTSSISEPTALVRCHNCGWTATGNDPRKVYPQADQHRCSPKPALPGGQDV